MLKLSFALVPLLQSGLPPALQQAALGLLLCPLHEVKTAKLLASLRSCALSGVREELEAPVLDAMRSATLIDALVPGSSWHDHLAPEILRLHTDSVLGAMTVALLFKADALVASLEDATEAKTRAVYEAVAQQADVLYFG